MDESIEAAGATSTVGVPVPAAGTGTRGRDLVRLSLPATGVYLTVLRTATASLAARLDFTIDEIEDLKIAVDEACAMLLVSAVPGADLDCEFELFSDRLRVVVSVLTLSPEAPSRDTFAWTVLTALAGEVDSSVDADGRVRLSLDKVRAPRDNGGPGAVRPGSG